MPISESILTALFCMLVVFAVLIVLWGTIRVFSLIITSLENRKLKNTND